MKKIVFSLAAILVAIAGNAQLLWKVSGNGLEKDSYIMGTHHVAPVSILDSIAGFESALNGCDAIYGEVKKSDMQGQEAQQKIMAMAMAPADSTMNVLYSAEEFATVDAVVKKYTQGMAGLEQMAQLKPAIVMSQLSVMQSMIAFPGFDPSQQLDMYVQSRGAELGKPLCGFETVDFQLNMLFGSPLTKQAKDLLEMAQKDDKSLELAHKLADAYRCQNLDELLALMVEDAEDMNELDRMIFDRNANWVKSLKELMPEQSVVVCVGAGHLPGEKGLIELLRNEGYTVEAM